MPSIVVKEIFRWGDGGTKRTNLGFEGCFILFIKLILLNWRWGQAIVSSVHRHKEGGPTSAGVEIVLVLVVQHEWANTGIQALELFSYLKI